jgi:hypothetical protein
MKRSKKKMSKRNNSKGPRQTLRETMTLLMEMYRRVLLKTGTVDQTLFCWTDGHFEIYSHSFGILGPSVAEAVLFVRSILRQRRAQQAIVADLIHVVEQPLFAPIQTPIKDQPGSVEAIVVVGANKHENEWMLQPFYRTDENPLDIVFDDPEEGSASHICSHPWFRGIEFTDFDTSEPTA